MTADIVRDPDLEWLDHAKPTGLVLSPTVIKERTLVPERQTQADTAQVAALLGADDGPALPDPWPFADGVLGWDARYVAGAPGGPLLPEDLAVAVPEHESTLVPDWAVRGFDGDAPWQLLVRLEPAGIDLDRRGAAEGWEATPQQRFERLLRETGVLAGVMLGDQELRLVYAPRGETSGWVSFPLRSLATVAGRPMLAGLKLVLGGFRLFNAPAEQRLRALLYVIHQAPGPMMAVAPTVELAKRNSKQRVDPLIEESEVLRERVKERRSRDSGNTVLSKEFPGGVLILTGANSAVGLRSMPARYLFLDEVDGYPGDVEGEGDPILLAERRSATFQRRKILLVSTPKTKSLSRIEREYDASDQRRYFVPCPHCHEPQVLEFANLRWPEDRPREAEYACRHCGALIGERHKTWMLEQGEWRPTAKSEGRTAGFHLSSLYSPVGWFSWADAAETYEQAQKAPDLMKGFVNTVLGLPFEEEAEAPEWQRLYERRESYRIGIVPESGLFLTAGVDVQKDRIEVEVAAWGRGKESWSVDYRVIEGDTARPDVWAKLDGVLARDWPHASGHTLPIRVMCVDAGYATQDVYAWVRQHPQASWGPAGAAARQPRTAVAVKGRDRDTALLLSVSKADAGGKRRGLRVWSVGTPVAKGELYRWLKLEWPTEEALDAGASYPPGACHFSQYGEEYFKQLTAERLVTRIIKGFPRGSWEKEAGRRNEALDCRVYARAAAAIFGLDRFEERHWRRMEEALARTVERDHPESASPRALVVRPPARQVIHSGYLAR